MSENAGKKSISFRKKFFRIIYTIRKDKIYISYKNSFLGGKKMKKKTKTRTKVRVNATQCVKTVEKKQVLDLESSGSMCVLSADYRLPIWTIPF